MKLYPFELDIRYDLAEYIANRGTKDGEDYDHNNCNKQQD